MESIFPLPPSVHWTAVAGCSVSAGDCGPGQIQVLPSLAVPSSCTAERLRSPPLKYPIVCRLCLFTCTLRYEHTHMFVTCSGPSVGNICTSHGKKKLFFSLFVSLSCLHCPVIPDCIRLSIHSYLEFLVTPLQKVLDPCVWTQLLKAAYQWRRCWIQTPYIRKGHLIYINSPLFIINIFLITWFAVYCDSLGHCRTTTLTIRSTISTWNVKPAQTNSGFSKLYKQIMCCRAVVFDCIVLVCGLHCVHPLQQ